MGDSILPSAEEFDAALEVDHTEPFTSPIFSIDEEDDEYEGKPEDMSTYAWDNLNDTTKAQYRDPNSALNRASRNPFAQTSVQKTTDLERTILPSSDEYTTSVEDSVLPSVDVSKDSVPISLETANQTDAVFSNEETLDEETEDKEIPVKDFKLIDKRLSELRKDHLKEVLEFEKYIEEEVEAGPRKVLGTEIRTPDIREVDQAYERADKAYDNVQKFLTGPNAIRSGLTDALLSTNLSILSINRLITTAEFGPFSGLAIAALDMPENWKSLKENIANGAFKRAALDVVILGATIFEGTGVTYAVAKPIKMITTSGKQAISKRNFQRMVNENAKLENASNAARKTVSANSDLKNKMLGEIEDAAGVKLTKEVDGVRMLDEVAARKQGVLIADELMQIQNERASRFIAGEAMDQFGEAQVFTGLTDNVEDLVSPLLKPKSLNAIVATAADLRKARPDLWDDKKTVIDNLYELAVNKELRASGELNDLLIEYGLSLDDFTLAVVGSGSEAGKLLQKLSMIRKEAPMNAIANARQSMEADIAGFWKRIENVRRGGMVSMVKTAMRNVQSTIIRSPTEGLVNVMESVLRAGAGGNYKEAMKTALPFGGKETWKDSFAHITYMFKKAEARSTVDYILDRPELIGEFKGMFNTVNEIMTKTNGSGKVLPILEKTVHHLNVVNRWQDHLTRRAIFLSKLKQLTKEQYGINLDEVLDRGDIGDLLKNKTTLVPKGKPKFEQLIEQSTRRALEITYAAAPNTAPLREMANFMTKYGLTTVAPFPRFMFSSMEYMAESAAGGVNVIIRRAIGKNKGKLTDQDRQNISRNVVGWAAILAAMKMRGHDVTTGKSSEPTSADWKELDMGKGKVLDTTPLFPLRQYLFIGELLARVNKGTLGDWKNLEKDAAETFLGSNMRTGTGNVVIDAISDLLDKESDLVGKEKTFKTIGAMLGNFVATFGIPFSQIPEVQRALGYRTSEPKDVANDPELGQGAFMSFKDNFIRPFRQRGLTTIFSPAEEAELETRQQLYKETVEKTRGETLANLILGMRLENKDEEWGDYLTRKGLLDYQIGSKSKVPSIKRKETEVFREFLPIVVEIYMEEEEELRKGYKEKTEAKKDEAGTEDKYINDKLIKRIENDLSAMKTLVKDEALEGVDSLQQAHIAWRRVSKGDRKRARQDYIEMIGKEPEYGDEESVRVLIEIASAGKISYMK
mgnify:CR=1 FL=1